MTYKAPYEPYFLLCAHSVPTILIFLVPVPRIYIPFLCPWHPHSHLQSWLHPWAPDSILGIFSFNYNRYPQTPNIQGSFDLLTFQFISSPMFPCLRKWHHLLPNFSRHNTRNHLWLHFSSRSFSFTCLGLSVIYALSSTSTTVTFFWTAFHLTPVDERSLLLHLPHTASVI